MQHVTVHTAVSERAFVRRTWEAPTFPRLQLARVETQVCLHLGEREELSSL